MAGKVLPSSATQPCPHGHWHPAGLLPMPWAFPCRCFPGRAWHDSRLLFNGKVFGGPSLGGSAGPVLSAAKGELKPLGRARGVLGACSTQGCPRQGDWVTAAWSSPLLPILWEPPAPTKPQLGPSQRACAPFSSFPPVLGKLFCRFKYNFFPSPALAPSQCQEKLWMAPFSPGCAAAGSSEGTLLLGFFSRGRILSWGAAYKLCRWKMGPESSRHQ